MPLQQSNQSSQSIAKTYSAVTMSLLVLCVTHTTNRRTTSMHSLPLQFPRQIQLLIAVRRSANTVATSTRPAVMHRGVHDSDCSVTEQRLSACKQQYLCTILSFCSVQSCLWSNESHRATLLATLAPLTTAHSIHHCYYQQTY